MVGAAGRTDIFLHFLAFELGRGPDGRWWVLGDRTQAPSGAGFALENRVATARALSDLLSDHERPSAGRLLPRPARRAVRPRRRATSGVAILTPGQHNETYFEHAYIARYLGLLLLEGEDLTVADGKVMVRTVEGPRPLSVLWRRLDSAFMDPLELKHESRIGTPGLVDAVRHGGATIVNAIGSGILETRALLAFLPGICRQPERRGPDAAAHRHVVVRPGGERAHVLANLDRMMIGPALATAAALRRSPAARCSPSSLGAAERAALVERLRADGGSVRRRRNP